MSFTTLFNRIWLKLAAFLFRLFKAYIFTGRAYVHAAILLVFSMVVGYIPGILVGIFKWILNVLLDRIPADMWANIVSINISGYVDSYFGQFTIYLMSEGGGYTALNIIFSALLIRFLLSFTPFA